MKKLTVSVLAILGLALSLPGAAAAATYGTSTVATHHTQSDCWIIISGKVYGVSSYMSSHPAGASAIVPYCGTEASAAFTTNAGGHAHSSYATSLLNSYYLGDVATTTQATSTDTVAPSIPTSLIATALSQSQIGLSWTAATDTVGVTGYKIYRGGSQVGTSASTGYTDTGLTASTTYTYTVAAYDAAGNTSAQSSSTSATTFAASTSTATSTTATSTSTTTPSTVAAQIAALLAKIQELKQQIANLLVSGGSSTATSTPPVFASSTKPFCINIVRALAHGTRGDDVREIQRTLGVEETGFFGEKTREAIKHYQRKNNVESTGVVGPLTRALFSRACDKSHLDKEIKKEIKEAIKEDKKEDKKHGKKDDDDDRDDD